MKTLLIAAAALLAISCCNNNTSAESPITAERWSVEKAKQWAEENPWYVGFNYIPAYAINYTAMWDKTSYDAEAIDKELALAAETGFNCVRVVLQEAVWADDPEYFLATLDSFFGVCARNGIKVMPCFFDDCAFGTNIDPVVGVQDEPLKG